MMMPRCGTRPELGTRPLPVEVKPVVAVPLGEVTVLLLIDAHFLVMACCVPTNGGDDRVGPRLRARVCLARPCCLAGGGT